jgi:hypothetical protein
MKVRSLLILLFPFFLMGCGLEHARSELSQIASEPAPLTDIQMLELKQGLAKIFEDPLDPESAVKKDYALQFSIQRKELRLIEAVIAAKTDLERSYAFDDWRDEKSDMATEQPQKAHELGVITLLAEQYLGRKAHASKLKEKFEKSFQEYLVKKEGLQAELTKAKGNGYLTSALTRKSVMLGNAFYLRHVGAVFAELEK